MELVPTERSVPFTLEKKLAGKGGRIYGGRVKRPIAFYFVATWCSLWLLIHVSSITRPIKAYQAAGEVVPPLLGFLMTIAVIFALWQIVGLFQLKPFNRWFGVVYCLTWPVMIVWNLFAISRQISGRTMVFFFLLVAFNLLSAWYLSRRSFREFSVQFVANRKQKKESSLMRKVSEKKLRDDIQNYRD